jgi:hypothetical protein
MLGAVLLTSCAQGQAHLTIHRNGTADLDMDLSVSKRTLELIGKPDLMKDLGDVLRRYEMEAQSFGDGKQEGLRASRRLNLQDLNQQPLNLPDGVEVERTEERKFFYTRYHVAVTVNMDRLLSSGESGWGQTIASLPMIAKKIMESQLNFDFLLTLPIKPGENNADETLDRGRTLLWHLSLFGSDTYETSIDVPNVRHIALTAGPAVLALAAGIAMAVVRFRRRRRKAD